MVGPRRGMVDVAASDASLAATLDRARGGAVGRDPALGGSLGRPEAPIEALLDSPYQKSRARREEFAAKTAEITYRVAVGELLQRDRVLPAVVAIASAVRRAMQRIPENVASRAAAESDARKVRALLSAEIEQVLTDLAGAVAALPDQLTATRQ